MSKLIAKENSDGLLMEDENQIQQVRDQIEDTIDVTPATIYRRRQNLVLNISVKFLFCFK